MLTIILVATLAAVRSPAVPPGEAVVQAAYDMYRGKWFHNAYYVKRLEISDQPTRIETWYEAIKPPGLDRVDVAPAITGRAIIYRNDSTYEFGRGQLRSATLGIQPLFMLLEDLHTAPPAHTIMLLKKYHFDLTKTHSRMWDGEPVVVVGAIAGDTTSNQFWLEKKRMLVVRLIEQNGSDPRRPLDARVTGYKQAGSGWLEGNVRMYLGGELSTVADYTNVRVDKPDEPHLFDPLPFHTPIWINGGRDIFGHVPNMAPQGHP